VKVKGKLKEDVKQINKLTIIPFSFFKKGEEEDFLYRFFTKRRIVRNPAPLLPREGLG
jgi:hypothetical protein